MIPMRQREYVAGFPMPSARCLLVINKVFGHGSDDSFGRTRR